LILFHLLYLEIGTRVELYLSMGINQRFLKDLDVFYSNGSPRCIRPFEKHCREKGIFFQKYKTSRVHDRVLIKNDNCAKVIGTSFGALGDKVSFILDLPSEDLKLLRQELHKIKTQT